MPGEVLFRVARDEETLASGVPPVLGVVLPPPQPAIIDVETAVKTAPANHTIFGMDVPPTREVIRSAGRPGTARRHPPAGSVRAELMRRRGTAVDEL
jgi:hypothetical protein